jgi:hypothetical protein
LFIAHAEVSALQTIAHEIPVMPPWIGTPTSASIRPPTAEPIAKFASLHYEHPLSLHAIQLLLLGTWSVLRLHSGKARESRSARKDQCKSHRKYKFYDFPEVHSSPLSESIRIHDRKLFFFGSPVIEWNRKYQANQEEILSSVEVALLTRHMFISGYK